MKKRPIFLLIDGSCLLTTAYYACIPIEMLHAKDENVRKQQEYRLLKTSDGRYVNALYAMVSMFLNVLSHVQPKFVAIVFDEGRDTFRRQKYDFYKANRRETPDPLKDQSVYAKDLFKQMGFRVFSDPMFEGGDLIASLIEKYRKPDIDFVIYSKDHDFVQLIDDQVFLLRPMQVKSYQDMVSLYGEPLFGLNHTYLYDSRIVRECYVESEYVVDLFALLGDSGDNIPGCKRVKAPARSLINYYHSIEDLYQAIDQAVSSHTEEELVACWKAHGFCKSSPLNSLIKYREDVFISKWLFTMRRDALETKLCLGNFYFSGINQNKFYQALDSYEITGVTIPDNLV